jgi:dolichol-phosphate mannosyltransferase
MNANVVPMGATENHLRTLVVVPTYCEAETVEAIIERVLAADPLLHVLIVDDNSPDGTGELAKSLAAKESRLFVLERPGKAGLGAAYIAGFEWALQRDYEVIVEMDADGSHQPEELPLLLTAVEAGAGLAVGTRWMPGGRVLNWPRRRKLISRAGTLYARLLLGSKLRDITSGYRAFRATTLSEVLRREISSHGYSFQIEMAWNVERSGAFIVEVPITFIERAHGNSKMSSRIVIEAIGRVTHWGITRRRTRVQANSLTADSR